MEAIIQALKKWRRLFRRLYDKPSVSLHATFAILDEAIVDKNIVWKIGDFSISVLSNYIRNVYANQLSMNSHAKL